MSFRYPIFKNINVHIFYIQKSRLILYLKLKLKHCYVLQLQQLVLLLPKFQMLSNNKDAQYIDKDQRENPFMTLRTVQFYCEKQSLPSIPESNQKLYLQYKSFTKIIPETISRYINLTTLYLNNNAISKIEGLQMLKSLKYLYLQHNFIQKMFGLDELRKLIVLNLSHNKIEIVQNLDKLQNLQTLNLSKNFFTNAKDIENLIVLPKLTNLDLTINQIESSDSVFQIIIELQKLSCLYLKGTPFAKTFKNYRKKFIGYLKNLKFLDDRPVLQQDHRIAEAWLNGGTQKQKLQKSKINEQKNKSLMIRTDIQKKDKIQIEQVNQEYRAQLEEQKNKVNEKYISSHNDPQFQLLLKNTYNSPSLNCKYEYTSKKQQTVQNNIQIKHLEEQDIYKKVQEVLGKQQPHQQEQEYCRVLSKVMKKWNSNYQQILQALLMKYKFDFGQVQPSFNMILSNIAKKIMKPPIRYELQQLRIIWTQITKRKMKQSQRKAIIQHQIKVLQQI